MRNLNRRDSSFIDKYDKIVNRSISEIEFIRRTYRWYFGIVGSIIVIAIAAAYFLLSDNIKGYEKIINKKYSGILTSLEQKQDSIYNKFVIETNRSIESLVAKNFNEKEIKQIIELVTRENVESFSKNYLDVLVEKEITPKINYIVNELNNSDAKIQLIEFYLSKVSALNDDRYSFEKLIEISRDKNHLYSNEAIDLVNTLILRYSLPNVPSRHGFLITEGGRDFNWTFEDCYNILFAYPKEGRITILDNVFNLNRFIDDEKIKLALQALKFDESLTVVSKASEYLISKFDLKYSNLEISEIIKTLKQKGYN